MHAWRTIAACVSGQREQAPPPAAKQRQLEDVYEQQYAAYVSGHTDPNTAHLKDALRLTPKHFAQASHANPGAVSRPLPALPIGRLCRAGAWPAVLVLEAQQPGTLTQHFDGAFCLAVVHQHLGLVQRLAAGRDASVKKQATLLLSVAQANLPGCDWIIETFHSDGLAQRFANIQPAWPQAAYDLATTYLKLAVQALTSGAQDTYTQKLKVVALEYLSAAAWSYGSKQEFVDFATAYILANAKLHGNLNKLDMSSANQAGQIDNKPISLCLILRSNTVPLIKRLLTTLAQLNQQAAARIFLQNLLNLGLRDTYGHFNFSQALQPNNSDVPPDATEPAEGTSLHAALRTALRALDAPRCNQDPHPTNKTPNE